MVRNSFLREFIRYTASAGLLIVIWLSAIHVFEIPAYLLPTPQKVLRTLIADYLLFQSALAFTIQNALSGAIIGLVLGVLFALLLCMSRLTRYLFEPYLTIFQSFPRESLLPLFVAWLGFGRGLKIISSTMLCFFPTALIVFAALMHVRRDYIDLLKSWGAGDLKILFLVRLPNSIPAITSAAKLAIPMSLIGSVLGEFMGGNSGIGHAILSASAGFRTDRICAGIFLLCIAGVIGHGFITIFQQTLLKRFSKEV